MPERPLAGPSGNEPPSRVVTPARRLMIRRRRRTAVGVAVIVVVAALIYLFHGTFKPIKSGQKIEFTDTITFPARLPSGVLITQNVYTRGYITYTS